MPAVAYEPIPLEIEQYVKKYMPEHEFLDANFAPALKTSYFWIEKGPFRKDWSLQLNFNGDGITDWVGYLIDTSQKHLPLRQVIGLYCICSSNETYTPIQIGRYFRTRIENGLFFKLVKWPPGTYTDDEKGKVVVSTELVFEDPYASSTLSGVYFWDGSKVQIIYRKGD